MDGAGGRLGGGLLHPGGGLLHPSGGLLLAAALTLLIIALPSRAESPSPDSPEIRRVAALGKLWGKISDLHPTLATTDGAEIDWDAALLRALPKVRAAQGREPLAAAISEMLAALGDPATRLVEAPKLSPPQGDPPPLVTTEDSAQGKVVTVAFGAWIGAGRWTEAANRMGEIVSALDSARGVILDLRSTSRDPSSAEFANEIADFLLDDLAPHLVGREIATPSFRYRFQSGYRPQEGTTSGGYSSGLYTVAGGSIRPAPRAPNASPPPQRVIFLVDGSARLPLLAPALRASGEGWIVSQGPLSGAALGSGLTFALGPESEGLIAQVRVSEMLPLGAQPLAADVIANDAAAALDAALAVARGQLNERPAAGPSRALAEARFLPDPTYPELKAPDLPHRQLAVIRAWNVIATYYPYLDLIGDWNAVLPEFLAKMESATTNLDYQLTLLEMSTRIPDGHTSVIGAQEAERHLGDAALPLRIRIVDGVPTIVAASPEAQAAGFAVGDEIVAVDDEPVEARARRYARSLTASTEITVKNRIAASLLRGPAGSTARVRLRNLAGEEREASMPRSATRWSMPPNGEVIQILPDQIGYVDLKRLEPKDVDGMFERFANTRGLIFDLRGYPRGTAWPIAPHINKKKAKIGAQFRRVQVWALSGEESQASYFFAQPLPQGDPQGKVYEAPIVVLIDDRAISQSEHSCLFFEAAADVRFVGTPTAGANGDVTRANLPGGLQLYFTGHDVRHADGRQLQRVGIQPHVWAAPTRAGLRDGKDEVLAAGIVELERLIGAAEQGGG